MDEMATVRTGVKQLSVEDSEMGGWNIKEADLMLQEEIGKGAFGVVRKGLWRGAAVAVKTVKGLCGVDGSQAVFDHQPGYCS